MRLKYVLYLFLLTILSFSLWTYLGMNEIEERMEKEKIELKRLLRDIMIKEKKLRELKLKISEEGLKKYTDIEALEILLSYLDKLRSSGFDVNIEEEAHKEGNAWKMDIRVAFKSGNSSSMASKIEKILGSKAPVVFLKSLRINAIEGTVDMLVSLYQPFLREGK